MGRAKKEPPEICGTPVEIDTAALREQFRALRSGRGLSQADAAALLGVSQATVSSFEHGRHAAVRAETLLAVRTLVMKWRQNRRGKAGPAAQVRTVLNRSRSGQTPCIWCGVRLPNMPRPVRFCPCCGGHQSRACECGARSFDAWANFCGRCGRLHQDSAAAPIGEPALPDQPGELPDRSEKNPDAGLESGAAASDVRSA
jgi:hypothetical protein